MDKRPSLDEIFAPLKLQDLEPIQPTQQPIPQAIAQPKPIQPTPIEQPAPTPIDTRPPLDEIFNQSPEQQVRDNPPSETYPITQDYGNYNPTLETQSGGYNWGLDIGTPQDTPIDLPDGNWEVIDAYGQASPNSGHEHNWENQGYGNSVIIQDKNSGYKMRISHLNNVQTQIGEFKGGRIGYSGNTGHSTGFHSDWEVYDPQGNIVDPFNSPFAGIIPAQR